jgi:LysM repeat protein
VPATEVATEAPVIADIAPEQVIVAEGDSLSSIAMRRGIPLEVMIAANQQLADPTRLYPGDMVNLPKAAPSPAE